MALIVLRCVFVLVAAGLSVSFINAGFIPKELLRGWFVWSSAG